VAFAVRKREGAQQAQSLLNCKGVGMLASAEKQSLEVGGSKEVVRRIKRIKGFVKLRGRKL
jgi:hypothetical protein